MKAYKMQKVEIGALQNTVRKCFEETKTFFAEWYVSKLSVRNIDYQSPQAFKFRRDFQFEISKEILKEAQVFVHRERLFISAVKYIIMCLELTMMNSSLE